MRLTRQQRRQLEAISKAIEDDNGKGVNPAFEGMKRQVEAIISQKKSEIAELNNIITDMICIEERLGRILRVRERLTGVTSSMFSKLVHMLGANHKKVASRGYRNYYCAGGDALPDMERLEDLGYVKRHKNTELIGIEDPVFYATAKGVTLVGLGYDKDEKVVLEAAYLDLHNKLVNINNDYPEFKNDS